MKQFSNNTDDDDTYDDKIRGKISDIRMIFSRLGNTVANNNRKKVKRELDEIAKRKTFQKRKKKRFMMIMLNQQKPLIKKEKYKYHDCDDLDYHGIRGIENLFDNDNNNANDYYQPILVEDSFKNNDKYYESRGDKDKKLSVKQYIYKIMQYLSDLINGHKTNRINSNAWRIQINVHVNFVSSKNTGETRTIFVQSVNKQITLGNETDNIVKGLLNFFLNNYQKEEIVLRNGSDFVFESVDSLSYHIHKTSLKRGKSYMKSPEWIVNKRATINPKNGEINVFNIL